MSESVAGNVEDDRWCQRPATSLRGTPTCLYWVTDGRDVRSAHVPAPVGKCYATPVRGFHRHELHVAPNLLGQLREVGLVERRQDDRPDAERRAASAFSRMPPTGSTRPLSVISPVMATSCRTGWLRAADRIAVAIVTPAEGPSLGIAPAGTCTCRSCFARKSGDIPELAGAGPHVTERRTRRLLHHVAELARENNVLVPARKQGRFDEKHVAAGFGPGQPGRDARAATCGTPPPS